MGSIDAKVPEALRPAPDHFLFGIYYTRESNAPALQRRGAGARARLLPGWGDLHAI